MRTYLITGGAGFIGINFARRLLERGHRVVLLDNFSRRGSRENVAWLKDLFPRVGIVEADIRSDRDALAKNVRRADVVHHLAGQVAVTTSVADPRGDFEANALGTFNVCESVRLSPNRPVLIYASTNKVYGEMEDLRVVERGGRYAYQTLTRGVSESRGLDFHSPYGCSKGCGDQYVRDYARIYGLKTVVMRQSCIYGERQFGIEDQGWVAWFAIAAVTGRPITIYGDGKQVRDVLHVDDLFRAWEMALRHIRRTQGQAYNIGGGPTRVLSLLDLIGILEETLRKRIPLRFSDWRPGDQKVFVADISKARRDFGWQPRIESRAGIRTLVKWVRCHGALFHAVSSRDSAGR